MKRHRDQDSKAFQETIKILAKGMSRKKQIKDSTVLVKIHCSSKEETSICQI